MNCKNCNFSLRTDYSYCPACGAKVIHERITFKGLIHDFMERYFNVDNTLVRTVVHLFTKPQLVIHGYLNGIRRKYLNPASLLAIALTLSGLSLFILKNYAWDLIDFGLMSGNIDQETNRKMVASNMEFSSFLFLAYVPIIAIAGLLSFNSRNLSFVEHLIAAIYLLANYSIITFFLTLAAMFLIPEQYLYVSFFSLGFMLFYSLYVYWRLNDNYSSGIKLARSLIYIVLYITGFFGVSLLTLIINLLTGVIEPQDFLPPSAKQ
jgi:hypothetical protein